MNEFHTEIVNQLKKFRNDKIEPFTEEDEENTTFRMDVYNELGQLGFTGMTLPEEYGGAGLSYTDMCVSLTELAKSSASYAVTISVSTMVQGLINKFGTKEQKETYLPELTSGEQIGAFALSESSSGSDAASLKTTAKKTDGGYILNGSKMWITSGGIAKTYIVMARTGGEGAGGISSFIIQDGMDGFSFGKKEKKMGWKTSPTRELIFENCFVPSENLLSDENNGFKVAMSTLGNGRVTISSVALGLAERAIEESTKYALERHQFKQPIFEFQGLQFMLADMAADFEAAKALVFKAANMIDEGNSDRMLTSMAKLKSTDMAMKVTTDAVQILGGVGYTCEYPVERLMRDAKVLQIVEGTNQIQKVVIARELKKKYS